MMKDCCDMVIYQQLIWEVKPRTIIETGAYTGACALWMADTAKTFGIDTRVFSIDVDLSMVEKLAADDANVDIRQGDAKQIEKSFPPEMLKVFLVFFFLNCFQRKSVMLPLYDIDTCKKARNFISDMVKDFR